MKRRLITLTLSALLLFSLSPAASAAFTDVPSSHWAYGDIMDASEAGLFQGISSTAFGRGQTITRAQFVTALVRLFGWESVTPSTPTYSDCAPGRWYYSAVETAHANGALPTYATAFRPSDPITREEMASMLVRGLGYSALAGQLSAAELPFSDVTSNRGYVAVAYDLVIITGYADSTFRPRETALREHAAVMLMRVYNKLHASSIDVTASSDSYIPIHVPTPAATAETAIPTTPLEPIGSLYSLLRRYKEAGTDLSRVAVVFSAGGVATAVRGSKILSSEPISADQVEAYLSSSEGNTHYSDTYASAYLTIPDGSSTVTLWYQSDESLAAKLQLCRLFGVSHYILEDPA